MAVINGLKMGIPKKALRESQLSYAKVGAAVADSSHQTFRVTFEEHGVSKQAFLKKLEPKNHYPELLAKISVATSSFKRLFQGKRSAEERLVFDDEDKLIGTLSICVDGFRPFHFANEGVPVDEALKEQVAPSVYTLIDKNIMEILLGRWFLDDDDAHPHNMSLAGDIDFDMFFYWFTIDMKEPRAIIGIPKTQVSLSVRDYERFPNVEESKPYHWPAFIHPGRVSLPVLAPGIQEQVLPKILPKAYAAPDQFVRLARDPFAQEQKLAAALKALLTYQPEVQRRRLSELFGDMTLNYTALDETDVALRMRYEQKFPRFCNEETNVQPFVDFMMKLYQEHYDNLYRVVVFYMGCDNNDFGVSLPATYKALYQRPSLYRNIQQWVENENRSTYAAEEDIQYDLRELQKRYHQVWRDAFAPTLRELLHSSYRLTRSLLEEVTLPSAEKISKVVSRQATDSSVTSAWELFGTMPELPRDIIESQICVDRDSPLREALLLLVDFTKQFHEITQNYYEKQRQELTEEDNLAFSDQLNALHQRYNLQIRRHLANTTSYAKEFSSIASHLQRVTEQVNFQLHLTTTDELMQQVLFAPQKEVLPFTHEEVKRQYYDSLFVWAKGLKAEDLDQHILDIIDKYAPKVAQLSWRQRVVPVTEYLKTSVQESGDNRLAYILSSGTPPDGALNTLLIRKLTPRMLQSYPIPSIDSAIRDKSFKAGIADFTKDVVSFAKSDQRFTHPYSKQGISMIYKAVYDWVDSLTDKSFTGLIQSALKQYEGKLWLGGSRRSEVEKYMREADGKAKVVAMIFMNGQDTSTLNECLFVKIIEAMQKEIRHHPRMLEDSNYKSVAQFHAEEHKRFYLDQLKHHPETIAASRRQLLLAMAPQI